MATIPEALNLALQHHRAGRLPEAEALYRQILQAQPDHPGALHLLGMIAYQVGRHEVAVEYVKQAIALNPAVAEFHNNLGTVYFELNQIEAASRHLNTALQLQPDYSEAEYNLANLLRKEGILEEAAVHYRKALELKPDYAAAYNNLGLILHEQRKLAEAVAHYKKALALVPTFAEAHNNLGITLADQGHPAEAEAHCRKALALKPAFAEAHGNLGNVLKDQGRLEEAVMQYRRALALRPDLAEAESQLMHQLQHLCDWPGLEELFDRQRKFVREQSHPQIPPFTLLAIPSSPAEQLVCARNHSASRFSSFAVLREQFGFNFARTSKSKLRIGYLSADFHQHATAYLIAELFELHDRTRFEVAAYSYGPNDGSEMRRRLVRACNRFVDISDDTFVETARRIYEDKIDILVDLKGHTKAARTEIVALRPAPIQVNYLGYPGTMGAECIDYIITDRFITPPGHAPFFSEKLVSLPDCYQVNDRTREIAKQALTRAECGLPGQGLVFCSFNNTYKIMPAVFDIWMRALRQNPGSVLWLLEANAGAAANLRREAKARGIEPERLVFAPRLPLAQHLARHGHADLFLDTWPYNAHTTASDALWAGLPVLTCAGETFASRVAGSLLTAIGLPELITHSLPEYEAAAMRLARDPSELAGLRRRLAKNRLTAPLFDSERFTRHLEKAYGMMWERYVSGEAPQHIEVPALPPLKKASAKRRTTRKA
jgi:predicted O-linked N-acetylglucosamine transferase (SPINDLY family)